MVNLRPNVNDDNEKLFFTLLIPTKTSTDDTIPNAPHISKNMLKITVAAKWKN